ncbi:sulfotransferase domain-containing protein [Cyanobacterium aponinum UTEX 3222]|uniref:sulfotransferase domain-containing protein n=1 Tax=Cyanobacterium aponinum TaxID=379064 RepID=UPI0030850E3A|nr:sulfotransferase domain-containing protein [Cyanobacterium aponinum UTEX 3222]
MKLPNLILGGAPKCGTSSIFYWLTAHPEICGSQPKETFYLMDKNHPLCTEKNYYTHGLSSYSDYFNHCSINNKIVCEATTHYIYQENLMNIISRFPHTPQIIFVLRKPEHRVYSSFQYTKNNLARFDKDISFGRYVDIVFSECFETFQKYCSHPTSSYVLFNDIEFSCYVKYLEKWKRFFPNNIHVMLFEELLRDQKKFMKNIAELSDIDPSFYDNYDFPAENKTYRIKNKFIHRWSHQLSKIISSSQLKAFLKNNYISWQANDFSFKDLTDEDEKTLSYLSDYFKDYNQKLSSSFNLDLFLWKQ